jgi:hypothetical protein
MGCPCCVVSGELVRELCGSHDQGGHEMDGGVWVVVRVGRVELGWMGTRADDEGGMVQESAGVEQWVSLFIRFSFLAYGKRLRPIDRE